MKHMSHVNSKCIVFGLCLCLCCFSYAIDTAFVLTLLFAFLAGFLSHAFYEQERPIHSSMQIFFEERLPYLISILYIIVYLFFPQLQTFVPVVIYDSGRLKRTVPLLFGGLVILNLLYQGRIAFGFFLLFLCVIALYLSQLTQQNIVLTKKQFEARDKSVEFRRLTEEKNRQIIEQQDSAIYTATLQERNRIAREIHDNVGHMLTRSILQVGAIKTINRDPNLSDALSNLQDTLNSAMTSIRTSVHDLHDDAVDLEAAIHQLAKDTEGLTIQVDYDMSKNLPHKIKYAFLALCKEAINNTQKHSNADTMELLLREHPGFYQLLIRDNGTNIQIKENGIGLTGMRERIEKLQGTIQITTNQGFQILVTVMKK